MSSYSMNKPGWIIMLAVAGIVGCSSVAVSQPPAASISQETKSVSLSGKSLSFEKVIIALSEKTGLSIAVDGEPGKKTADINVQGTIKEALDVIAAQFDCRWTQSKTGAVLFNRLCQQPGEYPQTNLPEMRQMAKDIVNLLSALGEPPKAKTPQLIGSLGQALSADQVRQLKAHKRLPIQELNGGQVELVRQAVAANLYGTAPQSWTDIMAMLDGFPHARLEAKQRIAAIPRAETPVPNGTQQDETILSYLYSMPGGAKQKQFVATLPKEKRK